MNSRARLIKENNFPPLPDNWDVRRFRFLFRESKERNGSEPVGDMLSVSEYHGVIPKKYKHHECQRTEDELQNYRVVHPGQLAVNTMWLSHLSLGVSKHLGHVSPAYAVYNISNELDKRFIHYLLRSQFYLKIYLRYLYGIRPNSFQIKTDDWNSMPVIIPPKKEQKSIADFLDRETTRIDKLIEKIQTFISVMTERRQLLIQNATIHGIDSNVPMKDSCVDWLGMIPAHWDVKRFRYIFSFGRGLSITKQDLRDEGVPCVSYGEVHSRYGFEVCPSRDNLRCVDTEYLQTSRKSLLKRGDFVFADTSEDVEGSGNFTYLSEEKSIFAGYHTVIARPMLQVSSKYLAYLFSSQSHRNQIRQNVKGVKVYSITQSILKDVAVLLPPVNEQVEIVKKIDSDVKVIDELIALRFLQINKLKEYKASLITEAVTGSFSIQKIGIK